MPPHLVTIISSLDRERSGLTYLRSWATPGLGHRVCPTTLASVLTSVFDFFHGGSVPPGLLDWIPSCHSLLPTSLHGDVGTSWTPPGYRPPASDDERSTLSLVLQALVGGDPRTWARVWLYQSGASPPLWAPPQDRVTLTRKTDAPCLSPGSCSELEFLFSEASGLALPVDVNRSVALALSLDYDTWQHHCGTFLAECPAARALHCTRVSLEGPSSFRLGFAVPARSGWIVVALEGDLLIEADVEDSPTPSWGFHQHIPLRLRSHNWQACSPGPLPHRLSSVAQWLQQSA